MNKIFAYMRVSTLEQSLNMQIDALQKYGVDEIFEEKLSGTKRERPELNRMLSMLRNGDSVVVYKLDRISRSTKHLIELVEIFEEKGVNFISIVDKIDTSTAMGRFFFRTMASIAELERDIIVERTKAGLQAAKNRGIKLGRKKADKEKVSLALKMYDSDEYTIKEIVQATGLSKPTVFRYIRNRKKETMQ